MAQFSGFAALYRLDTTRPELAKVLAFVVALLICTTPVMEPALKEAPRAWIIPDVKFPPESLVPLFVMERIPLPVPLRLLPVPIARPVPVAAVIVPLLMIVTFPPPSVKADTP